MRTILCLSVVVALSCFRSQGPDADGGHTGLSDVTVDTGPIGRCDPIAAFEQCWPDCRDFRDCPGRTGCSNVDYLCTGPEHELSGGDHDGFCRRGDRYLFRGSNQCFPYEFCRAVWRSTRTDRCEYSNGETFVDGPPMAECPSSVDPSSPYCGRGCAECPRRAFLTITNGRCTGLTEERGIGVCALQDVCDRDSGAFYLDNADGYYETPPICLVERIDGELSEEGFVISLATCRAYQELYPGDFACVDPRIAWQDIDDV